MKKTLFFLSFILIMFMIFLLNCPTAAKKDDDGTTGTTSSSAVSISSSSESSINSSSSSIDSSTSSSSDLSAGSEETFIMGAYSIDFHYVPGKTFKTGTDDLGTPATVIDGYWISEKEITYELWYAVRVWAQGMGYTFANLGMEGSVTGGGTLPNFINIGAAPTTSKLEPVSMVNWRDAMIFTNALTEYYNANNGTNPDLTCVYYTDSAMTIPIKVCDNSTAISWEAGTGPNDGSQDDPYIKLIANGFRLPTSNEWELAARFIADNNPNDGDIMDANEFYDGNKASGYTGTAGFTGSNHNISEWYPYAWYWYDSNTGDGEKTRDVGTKTGNALGLYDMSGNIWEWCFDWYFEGSSRVFRGGSWGDGAGSLQVGLVSSYSPYNRNEYFGFRVTRSIP